MTFIFGEKDLLEADWGRIVMGGSTDKCDWIMGFNYSGLLHTGFVSFRRLIMIRIIWGEVIFFEDYHLNMNVS